MTEKASRKATNIFRSLARSLFFYFKILILKFSNSLARSKNSFSDYEELKIKLVWPKIILLQWWLAVSMATGNEFYQITLIL